MKIFLIHRQGGILGHAPCPPPTRSAPHSPSSLTPVGGKGHTWKQSSSASTGSGECIRCSRSWGDIGSLSSPLLVMVGWVWLSVCVIFVSTSCVLGVVWGCNTTFDTYHRWVNMNTHLYNVCMYTRARTHTHTCTHTTYMYTHHMHAHTPHTCTHACSPCCR